MANTKKTAPKKKTVAKKSTKATPKKAAPKKVAPKKVAPALSAAKSKPSPKPVETKKEVVTPKIMTKKTDNKRINGLVVLLILLGIPAVYLYYNLNQKNTDPTLILKGDTPYEMLVGEEYMEPGFDASDKQDGNITDRVSVDSNLNVEKPGTYLITYKVKDSSGKEVSKEREVYVWGEYSEDMNVTPVDVATLYSYRTITGVYNFDGVNDYGISVSDVYSKLNETREYRVEIENLTINSINEGNALIALNNENQILLGFYENQFHVRINDNRYWLGEELTEIENMDVTFVLYEDGSSLVIELYNNDTLVDTKTVNAQMNDYVNPGNKGYTIGMEYDLDSKTDYLNGKMDSMIIYNSKEANSSNIVAWYDFTSNQMQTITDKSSNGYNMTLYGNVLFEGVYGEWSSWSSTEVTETANIEVQTMKMYR